MLHDKVTSSLDFELLHNCVLQVVGKLWSRVSSIPMGGPFSTQSVDLHPLWGIKRAGAKLRNWGPCKCLKTGMFTGPEGPCGSAWPNSGTTSRLQPTCPKVSQLHCSRRYVTLCLRCGTWKSCAHVWMGGVTVVGEAVCYRQSEPWGSTLLWDVGSGAGLACDTP